MRALRMILLRWREEMLLAQIENGEALMRDHATRLSIAKRELEKVQRQQIAAASPKSLMSA